MSIKKQSYKEVKPFLTFLHSNLHSDNGPFYAKGRPRKPDRPVENSPRQTRREESYVPMPPCRVSWPPPVATPFGHPMWPPPVTALLGLCSDILCSVH